MIQDLKIPWGHWDMDGYWYPNPYLKMSPEEQRKRNEAQGYVCKRCCEEEDER